ncbi:lipid II:glycine glycyltransferase FemX [Arthrobacter sp. H14]|uniref:lipid II:glycine glycyltransferase FemX n=1 Tax=Arthrobacter sp. H14 TaxID=1312959 RepID=UPI0004798247|nr:peptidoglycan bridge formation glycyltransferase FemA/FemB family protein [Arthrobacter sp. H14]
MKSFLQSASWAQFQKDLGRQVFQTEGPDFSYLAILERNAVGPYLYCPYGPVGTDREALNSALESLQELAADQGARFIRVEPVSATNGATVESVSASLWRAGCLPAPRDIQPSRTWLVDLRPLEDELLAAMKSTNRNLHRNIRKKGVSFSTSNDPADIEILLRFLHQTAERSKFKPQEDTYLRTAAQALMPSGDATLYVANLNDAPIGAALAFDSADTRTYAHAALDSTHRKLSAGIPMVVRMILDAKAKGLTTFDMWGIAPENDPDHPWAGFSYFKKSFGGAAVEYPGTWDLPVNKPVYSAYTLARKAYQQVGKIRSRIATLQRSRTQS